MIHPNEPRDCPDWSCTPARCRCGATDWKAECDHLDIPPNVVLGDD